MLCHRVICLCSMCLRRIVNEWTFCSVLYLDAHVSCMTLFIKKKKNPKKQYHYLPMDCPGPLWPESESLLIQCLRQNTSLNLEKWNSCSLLSAFNEKANEWGMMEPCLPVILVSIINKCGTFLLVNLIRGCLNCARQQVNSLGKGGSSWQEFDDCV